MRIFSNMKFTLVFTLLYHINRSNFIFAGSNACMKLPYESGVPIEIMNMFRSEFSKLDNGKSVHYASNCSKFPDVLKSSCCATKFQ